MSADAKLTVVTSFSEAGYRQYGRNFIETYRKFWPREVDLKVYHEGPCGAVGKDGVDLLLTEPCRSFLDRHEGQAIPEGREPYPGKEWKANVRHPRNFRFDAVKFARKVFAIGHAARSVQSGKMFWLDADMETVAPVPLAFLGKVLPDNVGVSHLPRPGYHSECGFVGYNLDHPGVMEFITDFEHVYSADRFFEFKEWHDSFIFDRMLEKSGVRTFGIPHTDKGTPVEHSMLRPYFIHYKGSRKESPSVRAKHKAMYAK